MGAQRGPVLKLTVQAGATSNPLLCWTQSLPIDVKGSEHPASWTTIYSIMTLTPLMDSRPYWSNGEFDYAHLLHKSWVLLLSSFLVAQLCLTLSWPRGVEPIRLLCPWDFPGKNTGVGCHFLLQGIFPTQGSNLRLLHWQLILSRWAISQRIYRKIQKQKTFTRLCGHQAKCLCTLTNLWGRYHDYPQDEEPEADPRSHS